MRKFIKCIIMLTFYILLVMPAFAAQNYYISNTPTPAGPNASLGEVWMKHGGARLQYDALRGPIQMNTNGMPVRDPAAIGLLPPLYPQKSATSRKNTTKAHNKAPRFIYIDKNAPPTPLPKSRTKAKKTTPKATPKTMAAPNSSPKPTVKQGTSQPPYTGKADPVAPTTNSLPSPTARQGGTINPIPMPLNQVSEKAQTPPQNAATPDNPLGASEK